MLLLATVAAAAEPRLALAARGGASQYGPWFPILTVGGEARVGVAGPIWAIAGQELYEVKRVLPPEVALDTGLYSEWEGMWGWNLGAVWSTEISKFRPYAGADLVAVRYYADLRGSYFAVGGRARGGVDISLIPHLGVDADVAIGAWGGKKWSQIETGAPDGGPVWKFGVGPVVTF
jgi:hypothetical protein